MRIVIPGGYGVFGSRLAELLLRDGHEVWLAGRSADKANAEAARLGARPMTLDVRRTPERMFEVRPHAVIDASGPFQAYGDDPYRIPRLCIAHGADYLDLSDDPAFTAGIAALDLEARRHGRRVLSGASSVPGLSSAVAAHLGGGFDEILLIDVAILPGNRAPRGLSVVSAILGQLGRPSRVWRGGAWRDTRGWSDRRRFTLAPGMTRSGYFIPVPDIRLFPEFFGARSVMFRAGMELAALNGGMSALATVRRVWPFAVTPGRARIFRFLSNCLLPLGSDRGGMRVAVVGQQDGAAVEQAWTMIAEAGDGPYVPGVAVRALVRRIDRTPPGARPCLAEITLWEIEEAMSDLAIATKTSTEQRPTLFQAALQDRWAQLPAEVRELHSVQDMESFSGFATITRGRSPLARLAAWFFRFPEAGERVPLTVTKTRTERGEIWERNFAGRSFRSYCTPAPGRYRYRERFWLLNYEQELPVAEGEMRLPVRRGWFLGAPLPRILLPGSESREYARNGVFHFDVALSAPLGGGLIVRYRGSLSPDRGRADDMTLPREEAVA